MVNQNGAPEPDGDTLNILRTGSRGNGIETDDRRNQLSKGRGDQVGPGLEYTAGGLGGRGFQLIRLGGMGCTGIDLHDLSL